MEEVSKEIRRLRQEKQLTLKDLSKKTELSISFLSQVERGSSSLAITSLKKIADALNVPITNFFEKVARHSYVVKKEEQEPFRIESSAAVYIRLAGEFSGRSIEPLLVDLPPGQPYDKVFSHPGEEFYYVLEGVVAFKIDDQEYIVGTGDSIHFPSHIPHYWKNPTHLNAKVLCVLTPVIFG